jgi:hypothetical protein
MMFDGSSGSVRIWDAVGQPTVDLMLRRQFAGL